MAAIDYINKKTFRYTFNILQQITLHVNYRNMVLDKNEPGNFLDKMYIVSFIHPTTLDSI